MIRNRVLRSVGLSLILWGVLLSCNALILHFRILDTTHLEQPLSLDIIEVRNRRDQDPNKIGLLERVSIDSPQVISSLFQEIENTKMRGTKVYFQKYPQLLMLFQYPKGEETALLYATMTADKKLTVTDGKKAYSNYVSEALYDLLTDSFREGKKS